MDMQPPISSNADGLAASKVPAEQAIPHTAAQLKGILAMLDRELMSAAKSGLVMDAMCLLAQGASPNTVIGAKGGTALHAAAKTLDRRMLAALLEAGANVESEARDRMSAAVWTIGPGRREERESCFRMLMEAGAPTRGALFFAARKNQPGIAEMVLASGVSPDADSERLNFKGRNFAPFNAAASFNSAEIVDLLLAAGADIDVEDTIIDAGGDHMSVLSHGRPLHCALLYRRYRIAARLIEAGANLELTTFSGSTPLILAAQVARHRKKGLALLRMLLKAGAGLETADGDGQTALSHAASRFNVSAVSLLLEAGANANHLDLQRRNALHLCGEKDQSWRCLSRDPARLAVANMLLECGACPMARASIGVTAIQAAIEKGDIEMASLLEAHVVKTAVSLAPSPRLRSKSL
jgi:ankyrin repeat protein